MVGLRVQGVLMFVLISRFSDLEFCLGTQGVIGSGPSIQRLVRARCRALSVKKPRPWLLQSPLGCSFRVFGVVIEGGSACSSWFGV